MAINKITQAKKQAIESKSVLNLPGTPSRFDYSEQKVKRAFIDPITGDSDSIVTEINRIVDELNAILQGEGSGTLETTAQALIGAVNELNAAQADKAESADVGDVSGLTTTAKVVVAAINELNAGKADSATVTALLATKQNTLTFDNDPTASSTNPVTSGGVHTALAEKADLVDGKVPASQLPGYVDDVLEYAGIANFPEEGESGKIYTDTITNKTYRWSGSTYTEISESLALGETASTAYAGNKGKANADAIAALQTTVAGKQDALAFDDIPTSGSNNPVKSSGIYSALSEKQSNLTFDNTPTANSTNPVKSGGVKEALDLKADKSNTYTKAEVDTAIASKQSTLNFDDSPKENSANPVKSGGVYAALAGKADLVDGKVPAAQLPSYVDDVLEYAGTANFPQTGDSGKIYIDSTTNKSYRWSGSDYVEISSSLALGETAETAYAGNKGKANAEAIAALQDGKQKDIISVSQELPVATASSADFVQYDGKLYRKKTVSQVSVTDLTNTVWTFNDTLDDLPSRTRSYVVSYYLNFTSNSFSYTELQDEDLEFKYINNGDITTVVYQGGAPEGERWNDDYKTISISGGYDVENTALIEWFFSNATLVSGGTVDYTYSYEVVIPLDSTPTANSTNGVTSGGVHSAITALKADIPFKTIQTPNLPTLTDAEKTAIVSGAYCDVVSSASSLLKAFFFPANKNASDDYWYGLFIYSDNTKSEFISTYKINDLTNVLYMGNAPIQFTEGKVSEFNGKSIPAYPSSTGTFGFESVNGTLSWVEKPAQSVEDYTIPTSDWSALSNASPYTYQATVTATHTIGNDTEIELINDQAVLFATHGFAIASVSGQVVTIYSIGAPSANVTLEVQYNG